MGLSAQLCFVLLAVALIHRSSGYRLPTSIIPKHYNLEIITNLGDDHRNFDFHGKVSIETMCITPTKNITLHSNKLDLHKSEIKVFDLTADKAEVKPINFETVEDDDFFIIYFGEPLKENHKYEIVIPYKGVLHDGLDGYYRSGYIDKATGKQRWLGVTQFEATAARKAFPCFDEPAMKATYNITLGRLEKYSSVSNMPLLRTEKMKDKEGWYWDIYEKSVPMSTYLVAFMVSDFGYEMSEQYKNNVTFRIWSRIDALNQVEFAKKTGPRALRFFEEFFDIKYPLPKQDMVALPDFSAGAMENWGLITYREVYLLHDPKLSSAYNKESIAGVIAHELAHQWFGNLVTMKWWTDLWLNEGFATYMATVAVDHLFPQWNVLDEDAIDNMISVYRFDSLQSSHPISVPIGHPRDIDQIFDTISYKKGSGIIRMMAMFLGEEVLRKGVRNYLLKHKYANAEQDDLWEALTEEAHKTGALPMNFTVKQIMDTWTLQTGYPVIQVNRLYDQKAVEVTQERYLRDVSTLGKLAPQCWWVPLTYTTEKELDFNNTRPKHWMDCNDKEVIQGFPDENEWIIFNIKASGLYRVNYDQKNWDLLTKTLNSDKYNTISPFSRVQLIENAGSLALTGHIKYDVLFDILKYLEREEEFLPWDTALSATGTLHRLLIRTPIYGKFQEYMKKLLEKPYKKVGGLDISNETLNNPAALKKQILLVSAACRYGVEECVEDAIKLFREKKARKGSAPSDLRKTIYCMGIKYGNEDDWNYLWNIYKTSNNANEKNHIMMSLGCTREIWLLQRYLSWMVEPGSGVRKQDASSVFNAVVQTPIGFYVGKTYLEENIEKIHQSLAKTKRLSRYIMPLANQIMTQKQSEELEVFTKKNEKLFEDAKQSVDQALETVKLNVQWHNRHYKNIGELLQKY